MRLQNAQASNQWHCMLHTTPLLSPAACCLSPLQVVDGQYKGATITAAGLIGWDSEKKSIDRRFTLVVTGASGLLEGVDGTISLMGGEGEEARNVVTFNLHLEGKHGRAMAN
jgi:hypothetical protein